MFCSASAMAAALPAATDDRPDMRASNHYDVGTAESVRFRRTFLRRVETTNPASTSRRPCSDAGFGVRRNTDDPLSHLCSPPSRWSHRQGAVTATISATIGEITCQEEPSFGEARGAPGRSKFSPQLTRVIRARAGMSSVPSIRDRMIRRRTPRRRSVNATPDPDRNLSTAWGPAVAANRRRRRR